MTPPANGAIILSAPMSLGTHERNVLLLYWSHHVPKIYITLWQILFGVTPILLCSWSMTPWLQGIAVYLFSSIVPLSKCGQLLFMAPVSNQTLLELAQNKSFAQVVYFFILWLLEMPFDTNNDYWSAFAVGDLGAQIVDSSETANGWPQTILTPDEEPKWPWLETAASQLQLCRIWFLISKTV